ncbi:MAG: sigma 54-interacting transcriptional regulator, partial [Candidatus Aminicenantes bacterium]|nr:sigma 54-interacting transcriptional regulator [Candidatus Aminicenantes bacterium]
MNLTKLSRRFSIQGNRVLDHWHDEKLTRATVVNTPENLLMINKIFGFHSNLMQNIVDFRQNNFEIDIVTQPFSANDSRALPRQSAARAKDILEQFLALRQAAQEWEMDFIDFSKFQILPGAALRFGWNLQGQKFPDAVAFMPIFKTNSHLHFPDRGGRREENKKRPCAALLPTVKGYLYRSDDFAANILHSHSPTAIRSSANLKVRINTQDAEQDKIIQDILFHHLHSDETLFMRVAATNTTLRDFFSAAANGRDSGEKHSADLVREFALFLKQSVFRKVVMVIDGLRRKEDGEFLSFLLDSGDIGGLTIILFNDAIDFDCDLELNEAPSNPLQEHFFGLPPARDADELNEEEKRLLDMFALIGVPVPAPTARALAGAGGAARIAALLKKHHLQENQQTFCLKAAGGAVTAVSAKEERARLAALAAKSDWPYLTIRHCLAGEKLAELERVLEIHARLKPETVAPGPAVDLIVRHLPRLAKNQRLLYHFLKILVKTGTVDLAEKLLAAHAEPGGVFARLLAAHLALRQREYQKLGEHLAGLATVPETCADEWRYLHFIYNEKIAELKKADAFAKKISDPYYRNLAAIQLSDRKIYNRDYARAQSQLETALAYFSSQRCRREEIETQNQMAKLQREKGCFSAAESLYKTLFIRSAGEGFRLNAAFSAVDLGNLYLENDDDFQAESWYQKALHLFEKEKNSDGIMLVNSNLINVHAAAGNWNEAERLLRGILARNEEKKSLVSCAIDYLNWAGLEYLRLNHGRALKLTAHARQIFEKTGNHKGLGECALLEGKILFAEEKAIAPPAAEAKHFNSDQKTVWRLCQLRELDAAGEKEAAIWDGVAAIQSKKTRFAAMAMILRKVKKKEWLGPFKELSRELSAKAKNYYYHEYWYVYFEQSGEPEAIHPQAKECFLAMHDFFTMNKRKISPRLNRLREILEENENPGQLFDNARLVGHYRQWRLPEDFFGSFLHEISQAMPLDWLAMHIHENEELLYRFSNSGLFKELGEEMMRHARLAPGQQNFRLAEIKAKFSSREKFFYPFANTKMIRWPISDRLSASLVVAFRDGEAYFQNFFERNRDVLKNFAILFQNFFTNELQIHKKLEFIIGTSEPIKEMKRLIAQISKVDFSLLITGESGSGKELAAKAVHLLSPRASRPFISVNAAALPETLLEAELFGFRKGAFSGAVESRTGLLEAADGGTFFLDEIADLPINLQAKMLRVLQEKEIRRLGENKTVPIDIRLISASNQNLKELIVANQFRADLYYRLQDLTLQIPPLRERREDIPILAAHFLKKFGYPAIDPLQLQGIADTFRDDRFPGNVRE